MAHVVCAHPNSIEYRETAGIEPGRVSAPCMRGWFAQGKPGAWLVVWMEAWLARFQRNVDVTVANAKKSNQRGMRAQLVRYRDDEAFMASGQFPGWTHSMYKALTNWTFAVMKIEGAIGDVIWHDTI